MAGNKTAFLGLGIMGGAMAVNLARAGFAVRGWNRTPGRESARLAAEAGVELVDSPQAAVAGCDAVFLCLTDAADIEEMLVGAGGLADVIPRDALVVDMSTSGPRCARELHDALARKGLHFLDAPVSGGDVGARNGTLTIMVGGEKDAFERCRPWLQAMGKNLHYCGAAGSGQAVKLCNQILCAVNMVAVCESLELAKAMGIDPRLVVDVCQSGAAGSWALANLGPRILGDDFNPGFKIKDMLKDLRLVSEAAADKVELPGTRLASDSFVEAQDQFGTTGGDRGTQAMIRAYRG